MFHAKIEGVTIMLKKLEAPKQQSSLRLSFHTRIIEDSNSTSSCESMWKL